MRRSFVAAIALLAMALTFMPRARAAVTGGQQNITGMVKDALNRPLADAQLNLRAADGRLVAHAHSGRNGNFEFHGVPTGTYAIEAIKSGFRQGVEIVTVTSSGHTNLEIALQAESALSLTVVTTRINTQPNGVTKTGNSQYTLTEHEIAAL